VSSLAKSQGGSCTYRVTDPATGGPNGIGRGVTIRRTWRQGSAGAGGGCLRESQSETCGVGTSRRGPGPVRRVRGLIYKGILLDAQQECTLPPERLEPEPRGRSQAARPLQEPPPQWGQPLACGGAGDPHGPCPSVTLSRLSAERSLGWALGDIRCPRALRSAACRTHRSPWVFETFPTNSKCSRIAELVTRARLSRKIESRICTDWESSELASRSRKIALKPRCSMQTPPPHGLESWS